MHYWFTTKEEFEKGISEGRFLEHAHVHSNIYGTSYQVNSPSLRLAALYLASQQAAPAILYPGLSTKTIATAGNALLPSLIFFCDNHALDMSPCQQARHCRWWHQCTAYLVHAVLQPRLQRREWMQKAVNAPMHAKACARGA